jgi:hypothetical protein
MRSVRGFSGLRADRDEHDKWEKSYTGDITSLGMSRGIPGLPGGLPRGSAREAGPVPPRPLPALAPGIA